MYAKKDKEVTLFIFASPCLYDKFIHRQSKEDIFLIYLALTRLSCLQGKGQPL